MLIFEDVLFEALFENVAKSVGGALGFFRTKKMGKVCSNYQPATQSDLCDSGQWMYQIYGQLACNPAFLKPSNQ